MLRVLVFVSIGQIDKKWNVPATRVHTALTADNQRDWHTISPDSQISYNSLLAAGMRMPATTPSFRPFRGLLVRCAALPLFGLFSSGLDCLPSTIFVICTYFRTMCVCVYVQHKHDLRFNKFYTILLNAIWVGLRYICPQHSSQQDVRIQEWIALRVPSICLFLGKSRHLLFLYIVSLCSS